MIISIIAAVASNMVIGIDNRLPWHIPTDLKWFKYITLGKPVIMGRKTFDSIGHPLPKRRNIIISKSLPNISGAEVFPDLDAALKILSESEIMIIGGAALYTEAIEKSDQLYITHVEASVSGNIKFPCIDPNKWKAVWRELPAQVAEDEFNIEFVKYVRIK